MPDHPNQPQEYDAVLGGQTPIPAGSAILGGIAGVKRRLASAIEEQRIAALSEALNYGEAGLDLVIGALQDESSQVEKTAYLLLKESEEPRVKQALREYSPWQLFECLRTLTGHSRYVASVAISPDGQTIVSSSFDKTIKVWHLATGELLRTLLGHSGLITSVAISPDGQTIVSGSYDKTIKVWHLQTGELIRTLEGHLRGELFRTLEGHSRYVASVAISPDGQTIVSGSRDNSIKVWNLQTGELLRTLENHDPSNSSFSQVAISPDGQTLVSRSGDCYNTIKIWHLVTGELLRTLQGHSGLITSVAISPDGQTLVGGSRDKTIKVWHLATGELLRTLEGHSGGVNSVAISPDGQTIVSGSEDNTIKIWGVP